MGANVSYLEYDPKAVSVQADPYPYYASLRAHAPVHWHKRLRAWIVSRHADVVKMLRDPRWSSDYLGALQGDELERRAPGGALPAMLFMDGADHTRLHSAASRRMSGALVDALGAFAQNVVDGLLDGLRDKGEVDIVAELATPLSIRVLARLLGVADEDLPFLSAHAETLAGFVDWDPADAPLDGVGKEAAALTPFFFDLVKQKRRAPGNDLVSGLVEEAKARSIRYSDCVTTAILFFAAGQMTTTHMVGNSVLALLRDHPARRDWRGGAPSTRQLVDELLRFDGPVQVTPRTAIADLELLGREIHRGEIALALLGSANRDEAAFVNPNRIVPGRAGVNVSFGAGPHYCLGVSLARVVGAVVLDTLRERCPGLALVAQEFRWRPMITQRGLLSLRVLL